jgi:hypothetical protein
MRDIMGRAGPILGIMRTAAETEPDIADLLRSLLEERLQGMSQFARWLSSTGRLRNALTIEDAAESIWTITSADVHHLLTVDRGWPAERYEAWLSDTLARLLLD